MKKQTLKIGLSENMKLSLAALGCCIAGLLIGCGICWLADYTTPKESGTQVHSTNQVDEPLVNTFDMYHITP
jgi:hypothetical protein